VRSSLTVRWASLRVRSGSVFERFRTVQETSCRVGVARGRTDLRIAGTAGFSRGVGIVGYGLRTAPLVGRRRLDDHGLAVTSLPKHWPPRANRRPSNIRRRTFFTGPFRTSSLSCFRIDIPSSPRRRLWVESTHEWVLLREYSTFPEGLAQQTEGSGQGQW